MMCRKRPLDIMLHGPMFYYLFANKYIVYLVVFIFFLCDGQTIFFEVQILEIHVKTWMIFPLLFWFDHLHLYCYAKCISFVYECSTMKNRPWFPKCTFLWSVFIIFNVLHFQNIDCIVNEIIQKEHFKHTKWTNYVILLLKYELFDRHFLVFET